MGICVVAIVWWAWCLYRLSLALRDLGWPDLAKRYVETTLLVTGLAIIGFVLFVDLLFSVW
jgi:hypothetical protein